ncbi:hypothetical protein EVAR_96972_1 [Eumeta japonica]|uniref:Uncharacterized protein n=1 Tax=Eumeta variegata TaxID=151549 RepID=A0A4C1VEE3_EUMVA|nr:hypothetical protein EVAR_96972_1 [Eumeta japonica]
MDNLGTLFGSRYREVHATLNVSRALRMCIRLRLGFVATTVICITESGSIPTRKFIWAPDRGGPVRGPPAAADVGACGFCKFRVSHDPWERARQGRGRQTNYCQPRRRRTRKQDKGPFATARVGRRCATHSALGVFDVYLDTRFCTPRVSSPFALTVCLGRTLKKAMSSRPRRRRCSGFAQHLRMYRDYTWAAPVEVGRAQTYRNAPRAAATTKR